MHVRLKQRILNYLVLLLVFALLGKLFFSQKQCKEKFVSQHVHGTQDPWNINEHHIEQKVYEAVNKNRRTLDGHLNPIVVPEMEHEGIADPDSFKLHTGKNIQGNWGPHQLGVVVPFRNRFEEMKEFVPHINKYLNAKKINHKIYIINQVDPHRFNRASLINVGFLLARKESCDYIVMHDVDLMPVNENLNYGFPEFGPFHVAAPHLHPKYHYKTFVGGILILSVEQFEELNGLSNKFWGWGREDDEFYMRIVEKGYKIYRHGNEITTGYETFRHFHGKERKRDHTKLPGQRKAMFERDHATGLDTLKYEIKKRQELYVDGSHCSVVDVEIYCDTDLTPWCDLPKKSKS